MTQPKVEDNGSDTDVVSHFQAKGDRARAYEKPGVPRTPGWMKFGHAVPYGVSTSMSEKGVKCCRL